jgi:hypothetical protein
MEHPSIANQVLSNESQAILLTQHSAVVVVPSKGSDLWVIESRSRGDSGGISPRGRKPAVRASMALNRQLMSNPRRERQAIFLGATEPRAAGLERRTV